MSDYLAFELATDADAVFRNFMRHNLGHAAVHFGLHVTSPPVFGWRLRSIGARARSLDGERWLRVVSQEPRWARGEAWTGAADANRLSGIPKPRVLDVHEWSERAWRNQRAEVSTLMPGELCSPTDVLHTRPDLPAQWWLELRRSTDALAAQHATRTHADQDKVTRRISERFGAEIDTTVAGWETVHGDLHWANLLCPDLGVLDWELWGRAPVGTDAATLLCYSLLVPAVAEQIRQTFADKLDGPSGRVAQLYVIARLLRRIDGGDYPELRQPLTKLAGPLLP